MLGQDVRTRANKAGTACQPHFPSQPTTTNANIAGAAAPHATKPTLDVVWFGSALTSIDIMNLDLSWEGEADKDAMPLHVLTQCSADAGCHNTGFRAPTNAWSKSEDLARDCDRRERAFDAQSAAHTRTHLLLITTRSPAP